MGTLKLYDHRDSLKVTHIEVETTADARAAIRDHLTNALAQGATTDEIIWVIRDFAQDDADMRRRLYHWAADCAVRVLPVFEAGRPDDARLKNALIVVRQIADGEIAANAAAADDAWDDAWDAAADAFGPALPALYAATGAINLATGRISAAESDNVSDYAMLAATDNDRAANSPTYEAAWESEKKWQRDRLISWIFDAKPTPLPL